MGTFHDHVPRTRPAPRPLHIVHNATCMASQSGQTAIEAPSTYTVRLRHVDTKVKSLCALHTLHACTMLTVYGKKFGYRITVKTPRGAPSNMLILDALHLHAGHRGLGGLRLLLPIAVDHHAGDDRERAATPPTAPPTAAPTSAPVSSACWAEAPSLRLGSSSEADDTHCTSARVQRRGRRRGSLPQRRDSKKNRQDTDCPGTPHGSPECGLRHSSLVSLT